jgi:hypothetical protein
MPPVHRGEAQYAEEYAMREHERDLRLLLSPRLCQEIF